MVSQIIQENGSVWNYDTEKFANGLVSVECAEKEGCAMDLQEALPKNLRTFWNPAGLCFVSYARARQLGINTDVEPPFYMPN